MAKSKITLGSSVKYIDSKGHAKLGLVTATPETVSEGSSLEALTEGYVGLVVFSPSGSHYSRYGVPSAEVAAGIPDYQNEDGTLRNVYEAV